ncbi:MAG: trypsin-like peptidase domain-containing protein [Rhodospirillales bacterium]|nr:trypsin-like peptidase domain-containing protein [Rhodospirillales bacterium]
MPFPYLPRGDQDEALFWIDDPFGLRSVIIPLFSIDRETQEISGIGTAFRVDPFGTYLTAYHVLESRETRNFFNSSELGTVFGFFSPGMILGRPPIPRDSFVFLHEAATIRGKKESPLLHLPNETVNVFDCAKLTFDPCSPKVQQHRGFLPLQVYGGNPPAVGDRVMAVGYPGVMNVRHVPESNLVHFTEGLHGAVGTITEILPQGRNTNRRWPTFVVSSKWPSGISGGPIFNEHGYVIGIVSSSLHDPDVDELTEGYSFWFRPIPAIRDFLSIVDTDNEGWLHVWAVLRQNPWELAGIFAVREQAEAYRDELGGDYEAIFGSNRFGTDDFVYSSQENNSA